MNKIVLAVVVPMLLVLSITYLPSVWIYVFLAIDSFTPWVLFDSPTYAAYHQFLVGRLSDKPELSIPEIHANDFSRDDILRLSHGFTFPVVVRELLINSTSVKNWGNASWWIENYRDEQILCGTLDSVRPSCTIKDFFDEVENNNPFYISGASKIFERHPELAAMIEDDRLKVLEPGPRIATQMFMGLTDMGSDIHAAIGVNIFRQIVGTKKWWFVPPSETPYLIPSMNVNGFSAHTHTMVGKNGEQESAWMKKLVRYTAVLKPGDILINPPWFWHGILNKGEKSNSLVVGCPTRFQGRSGLIAAVKSNAAMTVTALSIILKNNILSGFAPSGDMEDKIQANRVARQMANQK